MSGRFDRRIAIILGWEGGYVNDPHDRGGETHFGISKRRYPMLDIAGLTLDEARAIYKADYWQPLRCDELPDGIDLLVLDIGVLQGPRAAAKCLQRAAKVKDDGVIGPVTVAAVRAITGRLALCREITARRCKKFAEAPTVGVHGLGWYRRAVEIHETAQSLAQSG
jgi:lysozyme family protein